MSLLFPRVLTLFESSYLGCIMRLTSTCIKYIFFLFLFPGLDLVRLTIERLFSNKNIFYGDRNHFHHYLIKKYSMLISNLLLVIFNLLPMTLYYIGISFYYILVSFLITYFIILVYLRKFKN